MDQSKARAGAEPAANSPAMDAPTPPSPPGPDAARKATGFAVKLVALTLIIGFGDAYLHEIGWGAWLQDGIANAGSTVASAFTSGISRRGNQILGGGPILVVTLECTALFAKGLFCAAVYAFPCSWREKAWGFVVGLVGVGAVNVLRIAGLVLIGVYDTDWLEFAHLVLMQWFLISCVAPLWLAWAVWTGRRMKRHRATA